MGTVIEKLDDVYSKLGVILSLCGVLAMFSKDTAMRQMCCKVLIGLRSFVLECIGQSQKLEKALNMSVDDAASVIVNRDDLADLEERFVNSLKQLPDNKVVLGVDYPTYFTIVDQSNHQETRRKLARALMRSIVLGM